MAHRCSTRSVTWPALRNSLATRTMPAGEAETHSDAMIRRVSIGKAKNPLTQNTATKVTSDSTRPSASTQGLWRNQRRWMR